MRCEGKISRMEDEIGLSYPTIRNRLHQVIRALGYEPGGAEEPVGMGIEERQRILADMDKGLISAEEAMAALAGELIRDFDQPGRMEVEDDREAD